MGKKRTENQQRVIDFLMMNLGLFIVAMGSYLFKNPNKFASGGINGLAIVMQSFFPNLPVGAIMFVVNVALLILGYFAVDREFAVKSIYGSLMLSVFVWALEVLMPLSLPLTDQKLMELLFGVILAGIGITIVFQRGGSTGGTDIVAMILSRFFKIKLSAGVLISDIFIALAAGLVYGTEIWLFSIMGVLLKVFVMDVFLENIQVKKIFTIITTEEKTKIIHEYVNKELGRGATVHNAEGTYTSEEKYVTTTVLDKGQAVIFQEFIKEAAPSAFVTMTNSSNIIGRGFTTSI